MGQTSFPPDDVGLEELESLLKELQQRIKELAAIRSLAACSSEVHESLRQIARLGLRSAELADRVKEYAEKWKLDQTA